MRSACPSIHPSRTRGLFSTLQWLLVIQQLNKRCYPLPNQGSELRILYSPQMYSSTYGVCGLLSWTTESTTSTSYVSLVPWGLSQLVINGQKDKRQQSETRASIQRQEQEGVTSRTLHTDRVNNLCEGSCSRQFRRGQRRPWCHGPMSGTDHALHVTQKEDAGKQEPSGPQGLE